jgi:ribosomal protein L11 methylase PrmA
MVDAVADPADLIHDIGANTGRFSRLLAGPGRYVVSHDIDELAVERHYVQNKSDRFEHVLPLLLDLTNPSPAIGWALEERSSAIERMSRGTVVALALVHHLAISNNVPMDRLAAFFHRLANALVIEFVPKDDSQVQRLLASREDVFSGYTMEEFLKVFSAFFEIRDAQPLPDTSRTLFAMRRKR